VETGSDASAYRQRPLCSDAPRLGQNDSADLSCADAVVYATGVLELAGAVGLLLPRFWRAAGVCLAALFISMFIANIHASRTGAGMGGHPPTPMLLRGPMQPLFIAIALWSSKPAPKKSH
jgi:uncharacterized membrane protein